MVKMRVFQTYVSGGRRTEHEGKSLWICVSKAHETICSQHIYPEKAGVYNVCVLYTEMTDEKADDCVIGKMIALACKAAVRIPSLRQHSTVEGERL